MNKETRARIEAAPPQILVKVEQRHIDLYGRWSGFSDNPVAAALREAGYELTSIGMFESYIGRKQGVPYIPEAETRNRLHQFMLGGKLEPFVAEFFKKPIADTPDGTTDLNPHEIMARDDEIPGVWY